MATEKGCLLFLTTHSPVAIDFFSTDPNAQIVHVTHDQRYARVSVVERYADRKGVLDDLDVRASDLLQSNGIVWVEGPSDRLYFNRWIELLSKGSLHEGTHYQCVFYGGRLLSHLSADDPDSGSSDAVLILRVNHNAIILIDSDRRDAEGSINETKRRLSKEVEKVGGMSWVTSGREIENYLPQRILDALLGQPAAVPLSPFEDIGDYLERLAPGVGKRFEKNKPLFAERACEQISRADLSDHPELEAKGTAALALIRKWNAMVP